MAEVTGRREPLQLRHEHDVSDGTSRPEKGPSKEEQAARGILPAARRGPKKRPQGADSWRGVEEDSLDAVRVSTPGKKCKTSPARIGSSSAAIAAASDGATTGPDGRVFSEPKGGHKRGPPPSQKAEAAGEHVQEQVGGESRRAGVAKAKKLRRAESDSSVTMVKPAAAAAAASNDGAHDAAPHSNAEDGCASSSPKFILSSGRRRHATEDTSKKAKALNIDDDFEQYFAKLLL